MRLHFASGARGTPGATCALEVVDEAALATVAELAAIELNLGSDGSDGERAPAQFALLKDGAALDPRLTVASAGLTPDDQLVVRRQQRDRVSRGEAPPTASAAETERTPTRTLSAPSAHGGGTDSGDGGTDSGDGGGATTTSAADADVERMLSQFRAMSGAARERLRASDAELVAAAERGDRAVLRRRVGAAMQRADAERELLAHAEADPFDLDVQRRIEEEIRQRNVQQNLEAALEHNAESFASVHMLYVSAAVNNVPLKAFVDSGAQVTVMSQQCAERCGIAHLLDKRFSGVVRGVGQARIIGRVHLALLELAGEVMECSFTVVEKQGTELLLGLDMLRKHAMSIDLEHDSLRVRGRAIPFLPEAEVPVDERVNGGGEGGADAEPGVGAGAGDGDGTGDGDSNRPAASAAPSSASHAADYAPAPAAQRPAPGGGAAVAESKVQRLMELGFERAAVQRALAMCDGNEEVAAGMLLGQ